MHSPRPSLSTDELSRRARTSPTWAFPGNARLCPASSVSSTLIFVGFIPILVIGDGLGTIRAQSAVAAATPRVQQRLAAPQAQRQQGATPNARAVFDYAFWCGGAGYFAWFGWRREVGAAPGSRYRYRRRRGGSGGRGGEGRAMKGGRGRAEVNRGRRRESDPNRSGWSALGRRWRGTGGWEAPGPVSHGFDWAIPRGSVVGRRQWRDRLDEYAACERVCRGGCGWERRFAIRDPGPAGGCRDGEQAWRAKCPELLDSGAVRFQVHDFFPQPVTDAAVFLLRVVLHDWPDAFAHRILLRLREAAAPHTKLVLADFVLPLASRGAEKMLANFGKASANAYWMDLTMQVTFNGQERTLREIVALALTAGWKVVRVTKASGSLFGHIIAVPVAMPVSPQRRARAGSGSAFFDVPRAGGTAGAGNAEVGEMEMVERASSRCGTPTFGSRVDLPSVAEARARFGGGRKKKPSPLSVAPPPSSPSPNLPSYRPATSPRAPPAQQHQQQYASPHNALYPAGTPSDAVPAAATSCALACPATAAPAFPHVSPPLAQPPFVVHTPFPDCATTKSIPNSKPSADASVAAQHAAPRPLLARPEAELPPAPAGEPALSRAVAHPTLTRRTSHVQLQLPQTELRERSGSIGHPVDGAHSGKQRERAYVRARAGKPSSAWASRRRQRDDSEGGDIDDDHSSRRASAVLLPTRSVLAD
ncbi:O-methyltransferase-domain-containing protein [Mycena olivaceomarginata]|nr:O-methyltransferase-domain-containing protein [Mycena olivaceomarginata]